MANGERLSTGQQKIKGYRDLTGQEIDLVNQIKAHAEETGRLVEEVFQHPDLDRRWASIGQTHLQQGFMALTRSVARPESF